MSMVDEAALPLRLGWEHIRLLTDAGGPLPHVEEGVAGWPVPYIKSKSREGESASEIAKRMEDFVELVKAAAEVSDDDSDDIFELFDSKLAAGEREMAVVAKGDFLEVLKVVDIESGDTLWKTKLMFAGGGGGGIGRVRVREGYVLLQAAVSGEEKNGLHGEEDWHILGKIIILLFC